VAGVHDQAIAVFGTPLDAGRVRGELNRHARRWIVAAPPSEQPHRRLVAATLALDVAQRTMGDWDEASDLLEWGCDLLRTAPSADARERLWQLAALALIQSPRDETLAWSRDRSRHFEHVQHRLPGERRFELATIVIDERRADWTDSLPRLRLVPRILAVPEVERHWRELPESPHPVGGYSIPTTWRFDRESIRAIDAAAERRRRRPPYSVERSRELWQLFERLEPLRDDAELRAEVLVRQAYLLIRLAQPERADERLREAVASPADPAVRYLTHFLIGRLHLHDGRRADAAAAFARALEAMPGAQSAGLSLAAHLFERGVRDEAVEVAASVVTAPAHDPWRDYVALEYRFWPARLAALRDALR
jgi:tetratricopeptide (TPR) repeat protein